jgi:hypothetical protein
MIVSTNLKTNNPKPEGKERWTLNQILNDLKKILKTNHPKLKGKETWALNQILNDC